MVMEEYVRNKDWYEIRFRTLEYDPYLKNDPNISGEGRGKLWNTSVYSDGKIYSGDLNEYRLYLIREYSKHLQERCVLIIDEHGLRDFRPSIIACNGKLYDVFGKEHVLKSIDVVEMEDKEKSPGGLGDLFG